MTRARRSLHAQRCECGRRDDRKCLARHLRHESKALQPIPGFLVRQAGGRRSGALLFSTIACGILGVWATLTFLDIIEPSGHSLTDDVVLIGGVLLHAAAIWMPRRRGAIPAGVTATGVAAFRSPGAFDRRHLDHGVHDRPRFAGALGTFIACGALALIAAVTGLGAELAPVESASAWARERRPIRFQLLDS